MFSAGFSSLLNCFALAKLEQSIGQGDLVAPCDSLGECSPV